MIAVKPYKHGINLELDAIQNYTLKNITVLSKW